MPIVQRTGGRQDTVVDATLERLATGTATGMLFDEPSAPALLKAMRRAFAVPGQTVMASAEA